ncbi:hypothetical protein NX059_005560 [Plenodomus lindquistii]|nr:hypothetical protein NX059_005560 [Plenodomus lindquistii]
MSVESLPILFDDGIATASGFEDIVAYLRNHPATATHDLDAKLSSRQQTDRIAYITFIQSTATPLIDLSLYVSAENYNTTTSAAYTAILPWYANYTVPPKRRELARARTSHMGLSSLDVDTSAEEAFTPGRGTASSEYEAAKRAAGIPTDGQLRPKSMILGRGKGFSGLLGGPVYATRFRLDAVSAELLDPLSDLLGQHDYLFRGSTPSSLDCLTFGYLSLLFYPALPQAWLRETIETKYPRIGKYIRRMRQHIFGDEVINASSVWSIMTGAANATGDMLLPWQPRRQTLASSAVACTREILGNIPVVSLPFQRTSFVVSEPQAVSQRHRSELLSALTVNSLFGATAAFAIGLTTLAVHHRRSPRDSALIFWALRPSVGLGEAGDILSVFAQQLPSGASLSQF